MQSLAKSGDQAAMVARLKQLEPGDQALWGVMSVGEMLCHVRGAFRGAMGELPVESVRVGVPRLLFKAIALWSPMRWPKGVETVEALRRGAPAMMPAHFEADRDELLAVLEQFCSAARHRAEHPMMGRMSRGDWMRWGWLHTDHHLRQFGR